MSIYPKTNLSPILAAKGINAKFIGNECYELMTLRSAQTALELVLSLFGNNYRITLEQLGSCGKTKYFLTLNKLRD